MHISRPRPIRLPFEDRRPPRSPQAGLHPVLAFILFALLAVATALVLSAYGIALPAPCGEDPAACGAL